MMKKFNLMEKLNSIIDCELNDIIGWRKFYAGLMIYWARFVMPLGVCRAPFVSHRKKTIGI